MVFEVTSIFGLKVNVNLPLSLQPHTAAYEMLSTWEKKEKKKKKHADAETFSADISKLGVYGSMARTRSYVETAEFFQKMSLSLWIKLND